MNKVYSFILAFLIFIPCLTLRAQNHIRNSAVTGVCYAGNKVTRIYIPPPERFFRKGRSGGGSITVNYTGFSTQAKTAIDFAVQILEDLLPADTKVTIDASWEKLTASGVLAQSTITGFIGGFGINALNPLSYYPIALAEKISGESLNNSESDITLAVNSTVNWYTGTDGQAGTRFDLVTVAMHEICHGLGFFDSFSSDGSIGLYGINSIPVIYDTFVESGNGNRLTDTLKIHNNSSDLKGFLTGNEVYFNGPLFKTYAASTAPPLASRAKLYAPPTFDPGSSISHLDETATAQVNSLMTPFINPGEAIHNPGKYTTSILGDLGWINTRIIHKSSGDTENHLAQILLSVTIKSDTTYNHNKVGVVYSFNNFVTADSLFLTPTGIANTYSTLVTIPSYNSDLQYYFFAEDHFLRLYRSPSVYRDFPVIKNNRYHVYIGRDTVRPVISHTPVSYYFQITDSIKFDAAVTDNLGIDSVYVEYKLNNGSSTFIRLRKGSANNFKISINARSLKLNGKDSIQYRIYAVDLAAISNLAILPKRGYLVTPVEEISSTIAKYSTDFSNAAPDFLNSGFNISKPAGFSKFGLNSKHPYESPEDNSKSINYTALLRHPLKMNESGMLFSYNEIVLVEPGSAGTVFGSSDFFDYVILEGSKNFGKTWFNIIDGYDSRFVSSWEIAYNSSLVGDNSTYQGTESMLRNHTFLYHPSDKISAGDTMLLRFRLFSDPFANGWGWILEDLKVGPLVDAVPEIKYHHVSVYPNPGSGIVKINTGTEGQMNKPVRYRIFNASGICLIDATTSGSPETLVDISRYPPGVYIILLYLDDGIKSVKYSLTK